MDFRNRRQTEAQQQQLMRLQNEKLANEVTYKNQELALATMHLVQKGEILSGIQEELAQALEKNSDQKSLRDDLNRIVTKSVENAEGEALHLIVDNYATHNTPAVRKWLLRHPRFNLHFTPTGASWLNQIERFFGLITSERIRRGSFASVKDLVAAIESYIENHNKNPKPFVWTATPEKIFDKITEAFS